MSLEIHLNNYRLDLLEAHKIYADFIGQSTVGEFGVIPLDEERLETVMSSARAKKSQAVGVATKRLKRSILLEHLDVLVKLFDMTTTLAIKVCKSLIGRSVSNRFIISHCATPSRTAASKSADISEDRFKVIQQSEAYLECQVMLQKALDSMEGVKSSVAESSEVEKLSTTARNRLSASVKAAGDTM